MRNVEDSVFGLTVVGERFADRDCVRPFPCSSGSNGRPSSGGRFKSDKSMSVSGLLVPKVAKGRIFENHTRRASMEASAELADRIDDAG